MKLQSSIFFLKAVSLFISLSRPRIFISGSTLMTRHFVRIANSAPVLGLWPSPTAKTKTFSSLYRMPVFGMTILRTALKAAMLSVISFAAALCGNTLNAIKSDAQISDRNSAMCFFILSPFLSFYNNMINGRLEFTQCNYMRSILVMFSYRSLSNETFPFSLISIGNDAPTFVYFLCLWHCIHRAFGLTQKFHFENSFFALPPTHSPCG